jgi:hypothetical protein
MKKRLVSILLLGFLCQTPWLLKTVTDGFRLGKILLDFPYRQEWETADAPFPLDSQGFTYLGHGADAFVFASSEGNYVLKLFRQPPRIHPWRSFFRDLLGHRKRFVPEEKVDYVLSGAKLAFDRARDLTGLVYVHLNPTKSVLPIVSLKDKTGRVHHVDLGRCRFAIQHRAESLTQVFSDALRLGDLRKIERIFRSFVQLIGERASRGIFNADRKVSTNFGCLGEQVIEWDFGCYRPASDISQKNEIDRFTPSFRHFLRGHAPEISVLYENALIEANQ